MTISSPTSAAAPDVEPDAYVPDMLLRDCMSGTPLHAMIVKASTKGAWQFYVGTHKHLDPVIYWDRHRVGQTLQNGDLLAVGAEEMMRTLDATRPVDMHPGAHLVRALLWEMGDLHVMAQAVVDEQPTWWYIDYTHSAGRIEAEQRASASDYPDRHFVPVP